MGELDDEVAERARGTADISAFDHVLQEFLDEQVRVLLMQVYSVAHANPLRCSCRSARI